MDTILEWSEFVLVPDWEDLIALLPLGILGILLLVLGLLSLTWLRFVLATPTRPRVALARAAAAIPDVLDPAALARARSTAIRRGLGLVAVGAVLMGIALTVLPTREGGLPQPGPDLAVLLAGIAVALAGVASTVWAIERADTRDAAASDAGRSGEAPAEGVVLPMPGPGDMIRASVRLIGRVPPLLVAAPGLVIGAAIVAAAFLLAPTPAAGQPPETLVVPVVVGIVIALGSVALAVFVWEGRRGRP